MRINLLLLVISLTLGFQANAQSLSFLRNGISTAVKIDTTTPANSMPTPMAYYSLLGVRTELAANATLLAMSAKLPAVLGQTTMAGSLSVALASDQSALPLSTGAATSALQSNVQSAIGTAATTAITVQGSATGVAQPVSLSSSPLPSGAATAALQTSGNATLSAISAQLPSTLGAKTTANSVSVNIASDQAALPLPTGASTSALQTTGNTSLATIATNSANIPKAVTGSGSCITTLTTTAQTFTAPTNAIGFVIQGLSDNASNLRFLAGTTATITSGIRLEPGRDSGYIPLGASVSVIAESGTAQVACIQWIAQ